MSGKSIKRLFQAVTSFVLAGSMAIPNGISVFAETADDQSVTSVSVPVTITTDSGEGPDAVTVRLNSDNELAYTQLTKENGYSGSFTVNKSDLMDDAGNAKTLTVGADAADGYSIEVTAQPEVTVTPVTELAAQISSEAQTVNEELVTDGYNLAVGVNESGAYILTDAELSEEAKATLLSNTAAATGITSVMGFITGLDLHEYATAYLGTYEYLTHYEVTVSEAKLKMERVRVASYSQKKGNNSILSSDSLENYKAIPSQGTASAQFFYLKNPTCDPKSNNPSDWGKTLGNGMLYTDGLWSYDTQRNAYTDRNGHDISNRVAKWPDNSTGITYTVPKGEHWTAIFNSYKSSISTSLGVSIAEGDVKSIVLHPYKISRFNGSKPDLHMDCTVEIKCKQVVTATYMLNDTDGSGYQFAEAYNYIAGRDSTSPQNDYPLLKTVNDTTYVFSGWYTNSELTGSPVTFPYTMGSENITFYAAYKPLNVTVTTTGGTFTYDGKAHGATVTVEGLPSGYTYEASSNATATHVAEGKVNATCDTLIIRNAEGVDVTSNLNITKVDGSITITPATLTVTTESASKVYDGDPLTAEGSISGLVEGETVSFITTGTRTEVGTSDNTYILEWTESAKSAKKSNYTIKDTIGKLTVVPQSIDPESLNYLNAEVNDPENFKYDGKEHVFQPIVTDAKGNELVEGTDYTVSYDTENFTDVHTITVTVTGIGNYEGTVEKTYDITKRNVILVSATASKVFDGNPLTDEKVTVNGDGFVDGDAEYAATGTITEVGTTENPIKLTFADEKIRDNYTIEMKFGTLTVTPKAIDPEDPDTDDEKRIVVEKPEDSVYDGEEHVNRPVVKDPETGEILEEGKDYELTYPDDVTNAGEKTVIVEGKGNYEGEFKVAYAITPRDVFITTPDASKVYDGDPLTAEGSISGLVEGETVSFITTGTQTEVGISDNTFTLNWTGSANESNYTIKSVTTGKLKVVPQSIDPESLNYLNAEVNDPENFKYDGKEHVFQPIVTDAKGNELVEGTDYTVSYDTENFTDVHTITVTVTGIGNYEGTVEKTYDITKRNVILVSATASKVFDGNPLTDEKVTVNGDGFVDGDAEYAATGTITEVGTTENPIELTFADEKIRDNYTIEMKFGTLTVTPKAIDPEDPDTDDEKRIVVEKPEDSVYDGEEHVNRPVVKDPETGEILEEGKDYELTYPDDVTNAGEKTVIVEGKGNYEGEFKVAYAITPRDVFITTPDASKVYDGDPLTAEGSISGLVEGETVSFITTGTQTEVGISDNTFTLNWTGSANESNYTIKSVTTGKLKVVPQSIDPKSPNYLNAEVNDPENFKYDGKEHVFQPIVTDAKGNELVEGTDYTVSYDTENFTDVHTITVTVKGIGNYEGTVEKKYKITPRDVFITTPDASKVYDGDPLTAEGSISGLVEGETVSFITTGTQTEVGTSDNTYTLNWTESAKSAKKSNYTIKSVTTGKLTVVPQSIDPESSHYLNAEVNDPENFKYDGKEHVFQPIVTDAKGNELVEGTDYTVSYDTENFTDVHTITVTVTGIGNYEGTVKKTYDITRRNVILESATASKVFDGNPLTDETVTVNGDGFVKGDAEYAATGTITEVGTTENPIELTFADEKIAERILALFSTETYSLRDNYTIEMKFGTLTVTPKAIDPEDPDTDDEKRIVVEKPEDSVYDGEEHVNRPVIKDPETGEILEEGKDYELTYPDDVTNAGEKTVIVEGKGNYEGEFEVAYEITSRPITVKADDASKTEGRKDPEFTAQLSEELIEGNEIVYELNREEGEEAGEYAIHPTGAIKQGNYIVSYADGTLTINRAPETPVTNDKPRPQTPMTPNTSDSTNIVMYAGFAIAALIAILGVIILRKKEN